MFFDADDNLGLPPIECPSYNPACGQYLYSGGNSYFITSNPQPPPFYGTNLGLADPVSIVALPTAAGVITPTPVPPGTLAPADPPQQLLAGIDNKTLLLAAGGIVLGLMVLNR